MVTNEGSMESPRPSFFICMVNCQLGRPTLPLKYIQQYHGIRYLRHKVHHGIRYTIFFGRGNILVNRKIRRNMIKKEVRGHRSVLRDYTLGRLEGSNPKPYSLGCELSPLPYLWYYSLSNLYAYIDHSIRYTTA